jgi:hypothetical protein
VEVLVRQRDVDDDGGPVVADQRGRRRDVVGVDLRGPDRAAVQLLDLRGDLRAALEAAAREHHVREDGALHRGLVGDDATDAAGSDDEDLRHGDVPTTKRRARAAARLGLSRRRPCRRAGRRRCR